MTTAYSYIRFRRGDQQKGDSLDRQTEKSEEYARRKGWILDSSFRDLGVSAFRGRNEREGSVGLYRAFPTALNIDAAESRLNRFWSCRTKG